MQLHIRGSSTHVLDVESFETVAALKVSPSQAACLQNKFTFLGYVLALAYRMPSKPCHPSQFTHLIIVSSNFISGKNRFLGNP